MRAAVQTRYGPPEAVRVTEVDKPTAGAGELLVRVRATTVNRTDCGYRAGKPFFLRFFSGLLRPKARVLGSEFAGEVEAVGSGVTSFAAGDRVFGYNEGPFGGHAEYLTIPEGASVAAMPPRLTFEEAAAGTEGSHYALSFITRGRIRRGHDVLVNGATGGIGSAAVQLLKHLGADVTAVCDTDPALVEGLGADLVIDARAEDFTKGDRTYDVVLDAVGRSSFGRCRRVLRPGGTYLSSELGRLAQNPFLALVTPLLRGRKVRFPVPHHDQAMIAHLADLMASAAFTPLVDRRYPLEQIAEAYRYVETGRKVGNVVITLDRADDQRSW